MSYVNYGQPEVTEHQKKCMEQIIDFLKMCSDDGYAFVSMRAISDWTGIHIGTLSWYSTQLALLGVVFIVAMKKEDAGMLTHYFVLDKNSGYIKSRIISDRLVLDH